MPNALKAGFPCKKLWILDSKLAEDGDGSFSVIKSMSLWRAWTRVEAGLEIWGGALELVLCLIVELCEEGMGATEERDAL